MHQKIEFAYDIKPNTNYLAAMKLLIVAATEMEIGPFISHNNAAGHPTDVLITGVGMVATTYALCAHLQTHAYDLVLQAGVGGSYDTTIQLGEVLFITSDIFADLGAEDHDNYIDIFELGLLQANSFPYTNGALLTPPQPIHSNITLPQASGLTVNTVSGSVRTIQQRQDKYHCQLESMEGAAFHYACLMQGVPFAQVRAISNYVIPRDKTQWKMKDAITNLNNWLIDFTKTL
jgi:futalosine hydrolase